MERVDPLVVGTVDQNAPFMTLKTWLLQLPGVTEAPHRFGGTEFQVDGLEFIHSHGPSFLDIRLSKDSQAMVLKNGLALPHRSAFHADDGWVSFRIERVDDVERAKKLIGFAYENAKNLMEAHTSRRMPR